MHCHIMAGISATLVQEIKKKLKKMIIIKCQINISHGGYVVLGTFFERSIFS